MNSHLHPRDEILQALGLRSAPEVGPTGAPR